MKLSESELMWSVQALAQPARVQGFLFPLSVAVPDELALDFDNALLRANQELSHTWSDDQQRLLSELKQHLSDMSDSKRNEIWVYPDGLSQPEWDDVRIQALAVLHAFSWKNIEPPANRSIFIPATAEELVR